jgi:uncharacterized membrane protein YhiD involved in acid resistance
VGVRLLTLLPGAGVTTGTDLATVVAGLVTGVTGFTTGAGGATTAGVVISVGFTTFFGAVVTCCAVLLVTIVLSGVGFSIAVCRPTKTNTIPALQAIRLRVACFRRCTEAYLVILLNIPTSFMRLR